MYRYAGIAAALWIGLCMASFFSGFVFAIAGAPTWLPLPWSGFEDFVEGPDGRVYVGLDFYHRVLCYGRGGQFIASYPPPSGKRIQLAADARGHVYCLTSGGGDDLGVYDGAWQLVREYREPYVRDSVVWRLQARGDPARQAAPVNAQVLDRPARPGDIMFGDRAQRRSFACSDGTTLIRRHNHLERLSTDGQVTTQYAGPPFLWPLTFPWPALTAWPLAILIAYLQSRKKHWAGQPGVTRVERRVLVDVVASVLLVTLVGAIWFGGLMVLIDFNNSHTGWAKLVIVPTIAWFFFWPLALRRGWAILQTKLGRRATLRSR